VTSRIGRHRRFRDDTTRTSHETENADCRCHCERQATAALQPSVLMALHHHVGMDVLQACRVDPEILEILSQAHLHHDCTRSSQRREGKSPHL